LRSLTIENIQSQEEWLDFHEYSDSEDIEAAKAVVQSRETRQRLGTATFADHDAATILHYCC
jgi:hypothetical protein